TATREPNDLRSARTSRIAIAVHDPTAEHIPSGIPTNGHFSRTSRTTEPPNTRIMAIDTRPAAKLCVASLMAPSRYGPTKPPVLPTEFTSAIAAAAPTPRIDEVASAQNGPYIDA